MNAHSSLLVALVLATSLGAAACQAAPSDDTGGGEAAMTGNDALSASVRQNIARARDLARARLDGRLCSLTDEGVDAILVPLVNAVHEGGDAARDAIVADATIEEALADSLYFRVITGRLDGFEGLAAALPGTKLVVPGGAGGPVSILTFGASGTLALESANEDHQYTARPGTYRLGAVRGAGVDGEQEITLSLPDRAPALYRLRYSVDYPRLFVLAPASGESVGFESNHFECDG